jgi:hypothetical protein
MVLLALIIAANSPSAQTPLVGVWRLTYPAGSRIENGVPSLLMGTGTLRLEVRGDSLIGELVTDPLPEAPARPPARLAGVTGTKAVVLVSRTTGTLTINGEERPITAVSTWQLEVEGDSLSGTVARKLEGLPFGAQGPDAVTGVRQRP